jgi:S-(hydroxymethyl)glutathione dehydrogenase/alcohol dehydrogenase
MKFRAAVLRRTNTPLTIETVEAAGLQPGDVLVRIRACGLCHTDLETIQGGLVYPLPIVLGHEAAGIVEAVGSGVSLVAPGDHVVCSWNPSCGRCFYCDEDQPILCEPFTRQQPRGRLLDGGTRLTLDGEVVHHFMCISGLAEYAIVPEAGAIPVPKALPFEAACLIGCGVMTGVGAALNVARIKVGENVAVLGCGGVGLNAVQGARLAGAGAIIAVDRDPAKLETARSFGAGETVAAGEDAAQRIKALTGGRGADVVLEASGHPATFRLAFEALRPGGRVVILGKVNVDQEVSFRWGSLMGERRMIRSSYGGARPRRDFPLLGRLYLEGKLMLDELITARIGLDQVNEGFARLAQGSGVRTVVRFDG